MSQLDAGLSDELRRLVLERSHDLVTLLEPDGTIAYASPAWERVLGWQPAELVGRSIAELIHPDDHELAATSMRAVAAGTELPTIRARLRSAGGDWVWIDTSGTPVHDADGNVTHLLGTARDVSEREELRLRVEELDALYRVADAVATTRVLEELCDAALDALIDATAADRASLLLYDDGGVMRFRAWRGLSDEYRAAAEGHAPWTQGAVAPQPVVVDDVAAARFEPELEAAIAREGIGALAFVPLVHADQLVGKFMLYADEPHAWDEREIRLCLTIGNHLASATVRTQTGAELRRQREQLETIMATVEEGIIVQGPAFERLYANDAAARMTGLERARDLVSTDIHSTIANFELRDEHGTLIPPDELPGRLAFDGRTHERVFRYRNLATGDERWTLVRANPVRDENGSVIASVSVMHDITDSRRVGRHMQFLARAGELLNRRLDSAETLGALAGIAVPAFAGHVTVDLFVDGRLRCVGARHVDPSKTEVMKALRERYPPTVADHPVQRALRSGEPQFVQDVQAEASSMSHDAEHAAAIADLGNESGIVVPLSARGVTFGAITFGSVPPQRRFDEADLELAVELGSRASVALDNALLFEQAQARAHAADALQFVDDGVFLVDRDGIVRLWNPAAARTFRVRGDRAVGRHVADSIGDWETLRDRVAVARRAETLPLSVKGEERWISVSAALFPGGTVYAFRDVTQERRVEQLRSDFVSTVSHELRTPLAAIYGAALTLQRDDVRLEESQRTGLLAVISGEADRLARIVNDILWASRLDSGQMGVAIESCDAERIAAQVVGAIKTHAPTGIALDIDAEPDLPPVAADPDKLRQVLTNLVDNAIKYSPDGGHVYVLVTRSSNRIRFRVRDEGLGIPLAEQARIFEKFFRLDPQMTRGVGGTGLGLYICRELVERMHGRIGVNSDGRAGSTFWVELPVAQ